MQSNGIIRRMPMSKSPERPVAVGLATALVDAFGYLGGVAAYCLFGANTQYAQDQEKLKSAQEITARHTAEVTALCAAFAPAASGSAKGSTPSSVPELK